MKKTGKLVILTGFSGSGKDTLMHEVLKKLPHFSRIVTHTTRYAREGEIHSKDYYFVQKEEFESMISKGELLEHVLYGSDYKGTSKKEFEKVLLGENIIWRIDMGRAAVFEETFFEAFDTKTAEKIISKTTKVLIKAPTNKSLLKRFKEREKDEKKIEEFEKRLMQDLDVWKKHKRKFPYVIVNRTGKIEAALNQLLQLLEGN